MKSLKIITLVLLFLGVITAYGQKTDSQQQKKVAQPATEQTDMTITPANQPPAGTVEELNPSPAMKKDQVSPRVNTSGSRERDAKTPPEGVEKSQAEPAKNTSRQAQGNAASKGTSAKDDPDAIDPIDK